jgi:hypothetical protein|tara:strand:- start:1115 stop:1420 length:306 start_codon:yes stop_codon:yes gene_type:complete
MRLETIQSPLCENAYSIKLRRVEKAASPDSGAHERHRCWQKGTKRPVVGIADNAFKEVTAKPQVVGQTEMENEIWQALYARPKGNRRKIPTLRSYSFSILV